jgi:hypothetical protein
MSQCYIWLPVLIAITLSTLKSLRLSKTVMVQFSSLTNTHTFWTNHKLSLRNTYSLHFNVIESSLPRVQRLRPQTTHRHVVPRLRMGGAIPPLFLCLQDVYSNKRLLFPYTRRFESHTKFCMITKLCFRQLFNTINHNYMVQRPWIAKAAKYNRTNLFHFNLQKKRPSTGNVRPSYTEEGGVSKTLFRSKVPCGSVWIY